MSNSQPPQAQPPQTQPPQAQPPQAQPPQTQPSQTQASQAQPQPQQAQKPQSQTQPQPQPQPQPQAQIVEKKQPQSQTQPQIQPQIQPQLQPHPNEDFKEEAHLSFDEKKKQAIDHLRALIQAGVTEEEAKVVFMRYESLGQGESWTSKDARIFLFDLQEAFGTPRVVPDEALVDVMKELQLNIEQEQHGVTWVEFKSYMLYLQAEPLRQLHITLNKSIKPEYLKNAVLLTNLPNNITIEHISGVFEACGHIINIFIVNENGSEALVSFSSVDAVEKAVQLSESEILKTKIHVVKYTNQEFPSLVFKRKPSALAKHLAGVYLTTKAFDDKHHISAKVASTTGKIRERAESFAEEHKLKEKAQVLSEQTTELARTIDDKLQISKTISQVDQKYQISAKAKQVTGRVANNRHVKSGISFLTSVAQKVSTSLTELRDDTNDIIAQREADQQDNDDFEMQVPSPDSSNVEGEL